MKTQDDIPTHRHDFPTNIRSLRVENDHRVPARSRGHRRPSERGSDRQLSKLHHRGAEGMEMRLVLVAICLLLVTPIAGSFWYVHIRSFIRSKLHAFYHPRSRRGSDRERERERERYFSLIASDFLRAFENEFFDHASRAIVLARSLSLSLFLSLLAVLYWHWMREQREREGEKESNQTRYTFM